ncbi:hypothetical protein SH668x_003218 [Planctomicrobium sp. SH668]|uniref:hypothetical protein n=1 Tax=Planctomicrobium sp. SH668 TaxID=3448126 RepID=UPI003F5BAB2E
MGSNARQEAQEKARIEAEEKAKRDADEAEKAKAAKAQKDKEIAEQAERDRLHREAVRPDIEKLTAITDAIHAINAPEVSNAASETLFLIMDAINDCEQKVRKIIQRSQGIAH